MNRTVFLLCLLGPLAAAHAELFVGLEGYPTLATRSSDLSGFPNVTYTDRFPFEVSGAAAKPDGTLFLCNGAFTTSLYTSTLSGPPQFVATIGVDIHALAFGNDTLWGYSNFAAVKGIYAIDQGTGAAKLVMDVYTGTSFRFFALDYNPADDLLYGYTEYGDSGLYAIDLVGGTMTKLVGTIPAANGQGRGMAVGNNTVYLVATRGDAGIPSFAYDLSQGPNGTWVPFTNAYPAYHATGAGAWIPEPLLGDLNCDDLLNGQDINAFLLALIDPRGYDSAYPSCDRMLADCNGDGTVNLSDVSQFVQLLMAG